MWYPEGQVFLDLNRKHQAIIVGFCLLLSPNYYKSTVCKSYIWLDFAFNCMNFYFDNFCKISHATNG